MPSFYRTTGAIAALLSMNFLVWYMKIPIDTNFVFGNHITESIMIVGLLGLLLDLKVLNLSNGEGKKYLKLGVIALLFGAVFEVLSFASLMYGVKTSHIFTEWIRIAPFTIFLIGLPIIYISDKMSDKKVFFGTEVTGIKGVIVNMIICFSYTFIIGYLLFKYGYLAV